MKTKTKLAIPPIVAVLFLQGCATSFIGKAHQTTQLAADTLQAFVTAEYQLNPPPVSAATKATPIHQYANYIRLNQKNWFATEAALEEAYTASASKENETALSTILSVIAAANAQSLVYLAQIGHK